MDELDVVAVLSLFEGSDLEISQERARDAIERAGAVDGAVQLILQGVGTGRRENRIIDLCTDDEGEDAPQVAPAVSSQQVEVKLEQLGEAASGSQPALMEAGGGEQEGIDPAAKPEATGAGADASDANSDATVDAAPLLEALEAEAPHEEVQQNGSASSLEGFTQEPLEEEATKGGSWSSLEGGTSGPLQEDAMEGGAELPETAAEALPFIISGLQSMEFSEPLPAAGEEFQTAPETTEALPPATSGKEGIFHDAVSELHERLIGRGDPVQGRPSGDGGDEDTSSDSDTDSQVPHSIPLPPDLVVRRRKRRGAIPQEEVPTAKRPCRWWWCPSRSSRDLQRPVRDETAAASDKAQPYQSSLQ